MCSELVTVLYEDRSQQTRRGHANLEQISAREATLLMDQPLKKGQPISFSAQGFDFYGDVESTEYDSTLGWFIKIRLSRFSRWSGRMFVPEHYLALCASTAAPPEEVTSFECVKVFTLKSS